MMKQPARRPGPLAAVLPCRGVCDRLLSVVVFAVVLASGEAGAALRLRRRAGQAHGRAAFLQAPPQVSTRVSQVLSGQRACNCDCCIGAHRLPSEMIPNKPTIFLKCALNEFNNQADVPQLQASNRGSHQALTLPTAQESCPSTCPLGLQDIVIPSTPAESSYVAYCTYYCRPVDYTEGRTCVSLTPEERLLAHDSQGNPIDIGAEPQAVQSNQTAPGPPVTPNLANALQGKLSQGITTVTTLPCEQSDPCAYQLMHADLTDIASAEQQARAAAENAASIAGLR